MTERERQNHKFIIIENGRHICTVEMWELHGLGWP